MFFFMNINNFRHLKVEIALAIPASTIPQDKVQQFLCVSNVSVFHIFRVTGEEAGIVWRCLREVLHTRACHRITSRGQAPLLKPQLFQVTWLDLVGNILFVSTSSFKVIKNIS